MSKKILIIDDEDLVVRSIQKLLTKEGYEVTVARSGEEALGVLQAQEVDLIVCDVRMPGMNGVETIKRIRDLLRSAIRRQPREILITGYAEDNVNQEAEALQVADYIYKPFDLREFLVCVKKNLSGG